MVRCHGTIYESIASAYVHGDVHIHVHVEDLINWYNNEFIHITLLRYLLIVFTDDQDTKPAYS